MTEGISKKRLKELLTESSPNFTRTLKWLIHNECADLDTWLPIENAPKDSPIWLWNGEKHLAARWNERNNDWWIAISFGSSSEPFTHYKLLPEDPK